jgi:hypothetical protein
MSWNLGLRVNNLAQTVDNLASTALTNPMSENLNSNGFSIENVGDISNATMPINLNSSNSIIFNQNVKMNRLKITNNTNFNSVMIKHDINSPLGFVIDKSNRVGIRTDLGRVLSNNLTVNGNIKCNSLISGNVLNTLTAQNNLIYNLGSVSLLNDISINSITSSNGTIKLNNNLSAVDISCGTLYYTKLSPEFIPFKKNSYCGFPGSSSIPEPFSGGQILINATPYFQNLINYPPFSVPNTLGLYFTFKLFNPVLSIGNPCNITFTLLYWNGVNYDEHPSSVPYRKTYSITPQNPTIDSVEIEGSALTYEPGLVRVGLGVKVDISTLFFFAGQYPYYNSYEITNFS